MGVSICITSGKGGVGKTMFTANLGLALAKYVKDVTLLDADLDMSNLEFYLGTEHRNPTLHDVLKGKAEPADAKHQIYPGINVIPAGIGLDNFGDIDPERLATVLKEILKDTAILIIDSPAGLGDDALVALASANLAILVITADLPSLSAALKVKIVAKKLGANVIGAVLNKTTSEAGEMTINEIEYFLGTEVIAAIPNDTNVRYSLLNRLPLLPNFKSTPAVVEIERLTAELMGPKLYYTMPVTQSIPSRLTSGLSMEFVSDNTSYSDFY